MLFRSNELAYRDTLAREFSSVTCENVMKPSFVQATPGYFDFHASDAIVAFAAAHLACTAAIGMLAARGVSSRR